MKKIRVLVVEDQAVVREGIAALLSFQTDLEVVGLAEDGLQALELVRKTKPEVILLDLVMPRMDGLTTIPRVLEIAPETRILVLTSYMDRERVFQAIKSGALGYLLKDDTSVHILKAIRDAVNGQPSLDPSIAMKVINEIKNPSEVLYTADPLTPRELETLQLIARGLSNQEIANELGVNDRTVAKYVSSILNKLHLANRTQAALYAMREGISTNVRK